MDVPGVGLLAGFLRDRIAELGASVLHRIDGVEVLAPLTREPQDNAVLVAARQLVTVIVAAAGPFAPNAYSRARLIRQMHASGLLTDSEFRTSSVALQIGDPTGGAPR